MDGVVEDEITSIYRQGLHRTQKEADKNECLFAFGDGIGNMTYEKNSLKVGVTRDLLFFQPSLQAPVEQIYKSTIFMKWT